MSIVQVGGSGGRTIADSDVGLATLADLDRIGTISLGGRAAEVLLLGAPSAGAVGDLAKVTGLLLSAHGTAGLGDSLLHRASERDAHVLLNVDPKLRRTIDARLQRLYATALAIIEAQRSRTKQIAEALLRRRFLSHDEVQALAHRNPVEGFL